MRTTRFLATALVAASLLPMAALAETAGQPATSPVNQAVAQVAADKVASAKTGAEHKAIKAEHKKAKAAKAVEKKADAAIPATPATPAAK